VNRVALKTEVNNYWATRNNAGIEFPSSLERSYEYTTVNIRDFKA
jgi:hypothetical protein